MNYCELEDLVEKISEEEIIECLDDERAGIIPDDRLNGIIEETSSLIDSYVRNQVSIPLSDVSDLRLAKSICKDIVVYKIYQKRPATVDDNIRKDYEDAMKRLKDISCKNLILTGTSQSVNPVPSTIHVKSKDKVFTEELLKRY